MTTLPIVIAPNPILEKIAEKVAKSELNSELLKFIDDMVDTMYDDGGASGLAAPQVGVSKRIFVLDLGDDDEFKRPKDFYPLKIINPEIIAKSDEMVLATEGCLSVPGQRIEVMRPSEVTITYMDCDGNQQELAAKGWLARAIQHEIDHLDGKLLIDYLSKMKKDVSLRKLNKLKKLQQKIA